MKRLIVICAFCVAAHAQVGGTIIVFDLTHDGFFIAADSRAMFQNKAPEDNHCKIAAVNQDTIFAVSAAAAYPADTSDPVHPWDAIREARRASVGTVIIPANSQDAVNRIADAWVTSMVLNWKSVKKFHPEKVKEAARRGKGILTNGIFATANNGTISVTLRTIRLAHNMVVPETVPMPCVVDVPCASGELDIFNEFTGRTSDRAKGREGDLPSSPRSKVIRLVALTITYDKTGKVGGPIDALQLGMNGRITWFQQKDWCPEDDR